MAELQLYLDWLTERGEVHYHRVQPHQESSQPVLVVFVLHAVDDQDQMGLSQILRRIASALQLAESEVVTVFIAEEPGRDSLEEMRKQIEALRPTHVVGLGLPAAKALLGPQVHFPTVRGWSLPVLGVTEQSCTISYHPRDADRHALNKRALWDDLRSYLGELKNPAKGVRA